MIDLSGRVALVTGGSRGIGRACAIALARAGADVAVNYRAQEDAARETLAQVTATGRRGLVAQADVSRAAEVTRLVGEVEAGLGPVDILINNAGVARYIAMEALTEQDWDDTMAVNLKSAFLMTQAVLPGMRERGWGRIVNITSGAVHTGGVVGVHYTASKGGMEAMTRAYAKRLAAEGVTCNAVAPALVLTDMTKDIEERRRLIPMGRMGEVDEAADSVVLCCGTAYMTGQTIHLNGGLYYR